MKRTSRDIRLANRFDVLRHIIASPAVSRQEIVAETGLSLATVSTLVGELLDIGLLREVGYEDSGGGRPRGLIAVDGNGGVLVGVDVAETYVHVELFNAKLAVLARAETGLRLGENRPEQLARHIVYGVRSVLGQVSADQGQVSANQGLVTVGPGRGFAASGRAGQRGHPGGQRIRVLGVGVSVPGQVERDGGVSVRVPAWDWHHVPLRKMLAEELRLPVFLDHPLRASTVAELWFGAGRGSQDVVVVTLGSSVGAGLAFGGSVYRGASNCAGEWGHTPIVLDGWQCLCGRQGCIEAYVGASGIIRHLRELAPESPILAAGGQSETIGALARALVEGDQAAGSVITQTARYLGVAVAGLVNLLNPQVVVLSGWVAATLGRPLLHEVRAVTERHALHRAFAHADIVLCPVANNPVSLGAATFALEGFLSAIGRHL